MQFVYFSKNFVELLHIVLYMFNIFYVKLKRIQP